MVLIRGLKSLLLPLCGLLCALGAAGCATVPPGHYPMTTGFVQGEGGVRLHYVDYGGRGEPVLLLAGAGNTAWVYSGFARLLARDYHVFALTRRGHGESDMPEHGYDQETLSQDLLRFVEQRGMRRVHLIGHSVAGAEMTTFAARHPDRVASLIYLDAAYDRSTQGPIEAGSPERPVPPSGADRASVDAFVAFLFRTRAIYQLYPREVLERDIRASLTQRADGTVGFRMGEPQFAEFSASFCAAPPDYSRVRAPALAIYAGGQSAFRLRVAAPQIRSRLESFLATTVEPWRAASIEQYRRGMRGGEVVTMNAVHHMFLHKPHETAAVVRSFLRRHPIR